ncbi:MAG: MmcB family DNA repair protein [Proteobacteria bacterium]|nr:MmcB family DNA repair protein [Pseudomonadota bacterium]
MLRGSPNQPLTLPLDGRQSETASAVQRGVTRLMRAHGFSVLTEFTLASARRADVCGINDAGMVWIVEIKSSLEDFRADQKWPEYRDYCDRFSFAIPQSLDPAIIPPEAGLVIADAYGADIIRATADHPLHASRRKAITLLFARVAAQRLQGLYDP